jgi:hypothetical protein
LPSIENSLNSDDKKEKNSQGEVGRVRSGIAKWFIADDTDNAGDEQKSSKSSKEIPQSVD